MGVGVICLKHTNTVLLCFKHITPTPTLETDGNYGSGGQSQTLNSVYFHPTPTVETGTFRIHVCVRVGAGVTACVHPHQDSQHICGVPLRQNQEVHFNCGAVSPAPSTRAFTLSVPQHSTHC